MMATNYGTNGMKKDFFKITLLYTFGVIGFFYTVWTLGGYIMPEAKMDAVRAVSMSFGIILPDEVLKETSSLPGLAVVLITILSLGLIILNVFFSAVVTARLIQPRIAVITSSRGVLSTKWNAEMPHVLVRLSNFHRKNLVDLTLDIVLTVEEVRSNGIKHEQFLCYLPISEFTPKSILLMQPHMPWSIAVPADKLLSNSLTKDYHFKPGEPIKHSFSPGKELESCKRMLHILIRGTDTGSNARFVIDRKILVDEQIGERYVLHLHRGAFKSLPLFIDDEGELELFAA
jgi:hypothetical protein